jgi:multiple sugar transport system ATP-binding protein
MGHVIVRDARKMFGAFEALKGISLKVDDGEFVVLVGPSGCGKSTLLRTIAGLENISSGDIEIAGKIVSDLPPKDRDIAMVFQNYALYPHMTVAQNMGFSLKLRGETSSEIRTKVEKAAGILGLQPLLERYPRQLSGGQRQRVAMGRAIVRNPAVFLFDEPLSNLDAKLRVQMRSEIKELHQRLRTTTVYVTHDQMEAMTMADRIVVMRGGVIEQIGTPLELYDRPCNTFVAGFIGSPSMNFIDGQMTDEGFRTTDGVLLPVAANTERAKIWGVRPEAISLDQSGLDVEVVLVEPTGSETQVVVKLGRQTLVAIIRERVSLTPGAKARISFNTASTHLFDEQGNRIASAA